MADVSTGPVRNEERPGAAGAPSTAHPSLHPTSRRPAAAEGVASATTMAVEPSAPGEPPHLHAPGMAAETAHGHEGGGIKQKAKEVWHGIKEITPGTKEHRTEFGTDVALGGYRSQMGKR